MKPFFTEHKVSFLVAVTTMLAIGISAAAVFIARSWVSSPDSPVSPGGAVALAAVVCAGVGGAGMAGVVVLFREYQRLDRLADLVARVAQGDRGHVEGITAEGSVGRLSHRIVQVSHRMSESVLAVEQERDRLKTFLSDISHQLKTPLASLRMFNELLSDSDGADAGQREDFLARVASQIDRMEWLIRTLLTMARLEAGALELDLRESPIAETVRSAVSEFEEEARSRGIRVVLDFDHNSENTRHDSRWLREALSNLVRNAMQHTPSGGKLEVKTHATEVFTRIVVSDSGPGISAEDLPHVFTRFYRGRATGSGTGIGLSLTKSIVEHHGGLISVTSPEGHGARFTVSLPRTITKL